jgi:hypothetical protein
VAADRNDVLLSARGSRALQATFDSKKNSWRAEDIGAQFATAGDDNPDTLWSLNTQAGQSAFVLGATPGGVLLQLDPTARAAGYVSEAPLLLHEVITGASLSDLWLAGNDATGSLQSAHWDGARWSSVTMPPIDAGIVLRGLSTRTSSRSDAVGVDLAGEGQAARFVTGKAVATLAAPAGETGRDLAVTLGARETVRVTSNGRVGIGTHNPKAQLEVQGSAVVDGDVTGGSLVLQPQAEARCEAGSVGRLVMTGRGLFVCGADGKALPTGR